MDNNDSPVNGKHKTKTKSFLLVKAAMSFIRADKKPNISKPPPSPKTPSQSHDVLTQILGSVRPLRVSDALFPPPAPLQRHQSSESLDSISISSFHSQSLSCSSFGESSTIYGSSASLEDLESLNVDRIQEFDFESGVESNRHHCPGVRKISRSSPFASAMDLLQLGSDGESDDEDDHSVEEEEDDVGDDNCGDEMIDTKADAFITQFYSKMRVQGC